jgi:glycosyltransferase involved in cell wall biosynthesis
MDEPVEPDRSHFDLSRDDYVFLFNFDFMSTAARKNPGGVIEAFQRAFGASDPAVLVLKSINRHHDPAGCAALNDKGKTGRVIFLDEHLSGAEVNRLFASCDCYVSLHRAEGVGLGMAQAMYLGKPVIGTGYSGNLEFMNEQNSLLVKYSLVEFTEDAGPYEAGSRWAEPDVDHAASLMRWVFENREAGQALGARGAADIRRTLDPAVTAEQIRARAREVSSHSARK